jgi:hypothetical protein
MMAAVLSVIQLVVQNWFGQLKYEWISYSPEDLVDIANKEFAWCDAELLKASREMGFGDKWKDALEKGKANLCAAR